MGFCNGTLLLPRWEFYQVIALWSHIKASGIPLRSSLFSIVSSSSYLPSLTKLVISQPYCFRLSILHCLTHCVLAPSTIFSPKTIRLKMNTNRDLRHIGEWVNEDTKRDTKRDISSPVNPRVPEIPQQPPSSKNTSHMLHVFINQDRKDMPWSPAMMDKK